MKRSVTLTLNLSLRNVLGVVVLGGLVAVTAACVLVTETAIATSGTVARSGATLPPVDSPYDIGLPVLRTIWVDPRRGSDKRTGATRALALRTLDAAWRSIPQKRVLNGTGFRIRILPGTLTPAAVPNYFESRYGTYRFPIVIEAANGLGTVTLPAVNIFDTRYLYLVGLRFASTLGDAVHCERCDHFLLRDSVVRGAPAASDKVGDLLKQLASAQSSVDQLTVRASDCDKKVQLAASDAQKLHSQISAQEAVIKAKDTVIKTDEQNIQKLIKQCETDKSEARDAAVKRVQALDKESAEFRHMIKDLSQNHVTPIFTHTNTCRTR